MTNLNQKLQRQIGKASLNDTSKVWNGKNGALCIALEWADGFIQNSSNGQFDIFDRDNNPSSFYELIATGNAELLPVWCNSMSYETKTNEYIINGQSKILKDRIECTNKVGAYAIGQLETLENSLEIKDEASYEDFTSITNNPSFTMSFQTNNLFNGFDEIIKNIDNEKYIFAFPFLTNFKLFTAKITRRYKLNSQKIDGTNLIINYEVEFTHISNKLQKSGKSIEEYIHIAPPGSFFNWPKLIETENHTMKVLLNEQYQRINGVYFVDEEMYNACIQSNSGFIGWEVVENENQGYNGCITQPRDNGDETFTVNVWQPKPLFPVNFTTHIPNILNKCTTPINNMTFLQNLDFSMDAYTDWKTEKENQITGDYDYKFIGEFTYNKTSGSSGTGEQQITDYSLLSSVNILQWLGNATTISGYIDNMSILPNTTTVNNANWEQVNMFNFYINLDVLTLPIDFRLNIAYLLKDWAYVGGIFNKFTGGIPQGYTNTIIKQDESAEKNISGLIPSTFLNSCKLDLTQSGKAYLNPFFPKNENDRLNASNCNFSFTYNLSDTILQPNGTQIGTELLGTFYNYQKDDSGQDEHYILNDSQDTQLTSIVQSQQNIYSKPIFNVNKKFLVCSYFNHNFGSNGFKLVFRDSNTSDTKPHGSPIWQGAYTSQANYTNNDREWTNNINFNFFKFLCNSQTGNDNITFPNIPDDNTDTGGSWKFTKDVNNEFVFKRDHFNDGNSQTYLDADGWDGHEHEPAKIDNFSIGVKFYNINNSGWTGDTPLQDMITLFITSCNIVVEDTFNINTGATHVNSKSSDKWTDPNSTNSTSTFNFPNNSATGIFTFNCSSKISNQMWGGCDKAEAIRVNADTYSSISCDTAQNNVYTFIKDGDTLKLSININQVINSKLIGYEKAHANDALITVWDSLGFWGDYTNRTQYSFTHDFTINIRIK